MSRLGQMLANRLWPCQFGPHSVTGNKFTQAGSGDPSPANIRAITPWKAAGASTTVVRCGKNLIPFPYTHTTKTLNGITWTVNADGSVTSNGTASADSNFVFSGALAINPGTYMLSGCPAGGSTSTYFMYGANLLSTADTGDGSAAVVSVAPLAYTAFARVKSGTTISNKIFWPQIEKGSTKTAYEPYISKSATLAAPELYAGYMGDDWYWRRTVPNLLLNGTETWDDTNFAASGYFETTITAAHATPSLACSHFLPATSAAADSNKIIVSGTSLKVYPADAVATDKAGWLAWLASNNVTVAYNLATADIITPILP